MSSSSSLSTYSFATAKGDIRIIAPPQPHPQPSLIGHPPSLRLRSHVDASASSSLSSVGFGPAGDAVSFPIVVPGADANSAPKPTNATIATNRAAPAAVAAAIPTAAAAAAAADAALADGQRRVLQRHVHQRLRIRSLPRRVVRQVASRRSPTTRRAEEHIDKPAHWIDANTSTRPRSHPASGCSTSNTSSMEVRGMTLGVIASCRSHVIMD